MAVLKSEKIKIIGGNVGTAKATGKDFAILEFKNASGFTDKIFINQPSDIQKDIITDLSDVMGKEMVLITMLEEIKK